MIIRGYGIELERLKEKDIELVREKRNSPLISQFMNFRGLITPEEQKSWFNSIDNIHNLYYLIIHEGRKVGLINGAKIDWESLTTGSGGIFVWEPELWESEVPLMANLLMLDISDLIGLRNTFVQVLADNYRAIKYNTLLGYRLMPGEEGKDFQQYYLDIEKYKENTDALRRFLKRKYGCTFSIIIDDSEHPVTLFLMNRLSLLPEEKRASFEIVYIP